MNKCKTCRYWRRSWWWAWRLKADLGGCRNPAKNKRGKILVNPDYEMCGLWKELEK